MFEFQTIDKRIGSTITPKIKLTLELKNKGFNLTDPLGYCIINGGDMDILNGFGVTCGTYGKYTISLRGGSPTHFDGRTRYNFQID